MQSELAPLFSRLRASALESPNIITVTRSLDTVEGKNSSRKQKVKETERGHFISIRVLCSVASSCYGEEEETSLIHLLPPEERRGKRSPESVYRAITSLERKGGRRRGKRWNAIKKRERKKKMPPLVNSVLLLLFGGREGREILVAFSSEVPLLPSFHFCLYCLLFPPSSLRRRAIYFLLLRLVLLLRAIAVWKRPRICQGAGTGK